MKKVLIILLVLLIAAGAIFGITLAIKGNSDKEVKVSAKLSGLEEKYAIGDVVAFRVEATSDIELVSMTYVLNAEAEKTMTVKTGTAEELEINVGNGEYGIDSGFEMIDTAEMSAGNYVIAVYGYDANNTRYDFGIKEVFEIVSVQTSNT